MIVVVLLVVGKFVLTNKTKDDRRFFMNKKFSSFYLKLPNHQILLFIITISVQVPTTNQDDIKSI